MSSDDVLRVLVSTDNHLGVWEKDEVRKDDSFRSFEEVFEIAARNNADLVLLGGDLFHDNKPSRATIVRAMDIMTRHCMGDRPVRFQVVSDQAANFTTGRVNYEDPNYNVALPVLTIHGNHDDPAGAENLSAVDMLSTCRLVNYFGKAAIEGAGVGKLRIAPVLLRKGATQVALYGMGNLRDERLCRLFQTPDAVEWVRPADAPGASKEDWFNVFVLHQNRVAHTQNAKNNLREGALARFLDLVVWGHEHECLADPWESAEAGASFSVMQPGSSVATALSEGEARRKHAVMIEIMGSQWRSVKHPLETVRPFQFASVVLADQLELDPQNQEGVAEFLERKVQEMIDAAERERGDRAPALPLIRLRVDYSGFSTINTQRFGQKFVGKVANPNDMVLWQKAPQRKTKEAKDGALAGLGTGAVRPEALDESRIEDLIGQHLQHNLEILPEQTLTDALHEFVEKDNKESMRDAITRVLQETQTAALRDEKATQVEQDEDLMNVILDVTAKRKESADAAAATQRATQAQRGQESVQQQRQQQRPPSITNGLGSMQIDDDDDMLRDGPVPKPGAASMPPPLPPACKPRGAPAATTARRGAAAKGKGGGKAAADSTLRQSPLNFQPSTSSRSRAGSVQPDLSGGSAPAPARRGGSIRAAAQKATRQLAASYKDGGAGGEEGEEEGEEVIEVSSDDDDDAASDDELMEEELEMVRGAQAPASSRKRGRPAAAAPRAKRRGGASPSQQTGGTYIVSDEDEEVQVAPAAGRRRAGGAGMLPVGTGPGGGRSQPFGGLGTGSQQVSKGGWGELR